MVKWRDPSRQSIARRDSHFCRFLLSVTPGLLDGFFLFFVGCLGVNDDGFWMRSVFCNYSIREGPGK